MKILFSTLCTAKVEGENDEVELGDQWNDEVPTCIFLNEKV